MRFERGSDQAPRYYGPFYLRAQAEAAVVRAGALVREDDDHFVGLESEWAHTPPRWTIIELEHRDAGAEHDAPTKHAQAEHDAPIKRSEHGSAGLETAGGSDAEYVQAERSLDESEFDAPRKRESAASRACASLYSCEWYLRHSARLLRAAAAEAEPLSDERYRSTGLAQLCERLASLASARLSLERAVGDA